MAFNEIYDFYFNAISCLSEGGRNSDFTAVDNQFLNNHCHHLGQGHPGANDMAAFYAVGVGLGIIVKGNVLHDVVCSMYGGSGIYLDGDASYFTLRNNLIYNCNYDGFHFKGFDNRIVNNIVYNIPRAFAPLIPGFEQPVAYVEHNILVSSSPVIFTSRFVDPEKLNFISRNNLLWSIDGGQRLEVGRMGDCGLAYKIRMDFAAWRDKTGRNKDSVIVPVEFRDPSAGDFRLTDATLEAAQAWDLSPSRSARGRGPWANGRRFRSRPTTKR